MAELSSMPHLDENQNTSTLSNHVPESDDNLLTSTNITSEYAYQSPTSVKGNFSEINSNSTVLSPKNLNILTTETEGSFVKLEVDSLNVSILGETENSFKTANGSILGENNGSFRSLSGSYLEETTKSPNNSVKSSLDDTVTKVESPTVCANANTSLQGSEGFKNGISFNDASSPICRGVSITEVVENSQVLDVISTTITSPMGNNSSSPESKANTLVANRLDAISVELPSENQTSTENKADTSAISLLVTTSTLELPSDTQTSVTEDKPDASVKISVDIAATFGSPASNQTSSTENKPDTSFKSLSGTSPLGSPVVNQTSFTIEKSDTPVKGLLNTSTLESPAVDQTSFTIEKPDTPVKGLLSTSTLGSPAVDQTSFTVEKPDTPIRGLLNTSTLGSPAVDQTSFTIEKPDTPVKSLLGTSTLGSPAVDQTSFNAEKPDTPVKGFLSTSTLGSPAVDQTSFNAEKPDTPVKGFLSTSTLGSPAVDQTTFNAEKPDTPVKGFLSTSTLGSPAVDQTSFTIEKPDTPVQGLLGTSSLGLPAVGQTSFTIEKPDILVKNSLTVSPLGNCSALIEDKLDAPVKSPLETTSSTEFSFGYNASSTEDRADASVKTLLDTMSKVVSPLPTPESSTCPNKQELEGNAGVDISFHNASPLPNKSASITVDSALVNDSLLSNHEVKTNSANDLNRSASDQASAGSCAFTDNSDFVSNHFQHVESTPKNNVGFSDTSRLIDFSMIEDKSTVEEFDFKVPSVKLDWSNTPNHNSTDFQTTSQLSNQSNGTAVIETFDGVLHEDKINVPGEDPFGMRKSDSFDLIAMDMNSNPNDDFMFKVPEIPSNVENEEFTDAVQFFKDPSSFQFLENIKTSQTETNLPRSSLYIKFDPLHSAFPSQSSDILQALKNEANLDPNKQLNLSARESLGNILISFDSPCLADLRDARTPVMTAPVRVYTEEELQQHLKVNELTNQEMLLKKQREMEEELVRKEKEMMARAEEKDAKIAQVENLLKVYTKCLEEFALVSSTVSVKNKELLKKMEELEEENVKIKGDVKNLTEDLQSVETTFADFHKRYEQCKGMLKTYKDNEELLRTKLKEQEQAYQVLQNRTQESSEKASSEISNVKKSSEAQIAVLKAQLKKAELKISSLESDIKQIKIENSQLGGICDDLMEKVGKS